MQGAGGAIGSGAVQASRRRSPSQPEARAAFGKSARPDLREGCGVVHIATATADFTLVGWGYDEERHAIDGRCGGFDDGGNLRGWLVHACRAPTVQKAWRLTAISRRQKSQALGIRRQRPLTWSGGNPGGWNGPKPGGTMKLSPCRATPLFLMLFRVPLFDRPLPSGPHPERATAARQRHEARGPRTV